VAGNRRVSVADGCGRSLAEVSRQRELLRIFGQTGARAGRKLFARGGAAEPARQLEAERTGHADEATLSVLEAERVDRQYLPAWTAANVFFRQSNDVQFWRAAARAAAMSYDDPAPLIDLADHREARALNALDQLGDTPRLERGYLHFLIRAGRWEEAQEIAARLTRRREAQDTELLMSFTDRLIAAGKTEAALAVWNDLERSRRVMGLTNGDFASQPSGHGFDWRVTAPPSGSARWEPARLRFWLTGSTPDACVLLGQWVPLAGGQYRLQFGYRTEGLAQETGLRWTLARETREEAASPVLARSPEPLSHGHKTEWNFKVVKAGLFRLQLVYVRVPGTTHTEGRAEFGSVGLERL